VVVDPTTVDSTNVPSVDGFVAGVLTQWNGTQFVPVVKITVPSS
jgi:hypothetical protein